MDQRSAVLALIAALAVSPSIAGAVPRQTAAPRPQAIGAPGEAPRPYLVRLAGPAVIELARPTASQGLQLSVSQRRALQSALARRQAGVAGAVEALGVPVVGRYQVSLNGVQVLATVDQARTVARLPGVSGVEAIPSLAPTIDRSVPHVGAPRVWQDLGWDGTGVTVAVIDSGIDYAHLAFGGFGVPDAWLANNPRVVEPGSFPTTKVTGGYDFAGEVYSDSCPVDAPPDECSRIPEPDADPLDGPGGHGSHIAGIAAGEGVGNLPPGVAPGARLVALKVLGRPLAYEWTTSLWGLALEWATAHNLGLAVPGTAPQGPIRVVNLSLARSWAGESAVAEELVSAAVAAGITVVAAAGNDGNRPYIVSAPASAEAALSVAGSESPGATAILLSAEWSSDGGSGRLLPEPTVVEGAGDWLPHLVQTGPVEADLAWFGLACGDEPPAQEVTGRVALVERGQCPFFDKVWNAQRRGAKAVIVFTDLRDKAQMGCVAPSDCGQRPAIPAVMIDRRPGITLREWTLTPERRVRVRLSDDHRRPITDAITAASSRGPARASGSIKPEITAPGAAIRSADASTGRGLVAYSGTSVAAPFASGVAALLWQAEQAQPSADPRQPLWVAAKLMNYAHPVVRLDDPVAGPLAPAARQGAGLLDAYASLRGASVVRSETGIAALSFGPVHVLDDGRTESLQLVKTLEIVNRHSAEERRYRSAVTLSDSRDALHGVTLTLPADVLRLAPGERKDVAVALAIRTALLPDWRIDDELALWDEDRYRGPEVDGWVTFSQVDPGGALVEDGERLVVPFEALPRRHACIGSTTTGEFALDGASLAAEQRWRNECGTPGRLAVYHRVASDNEEGLTVPGFDPRVDVTDVGLRWAQGALPRDGQADLEFAIRTASSRRIPFDTEFHLYLDVDGDGQFDRAVLAMPELIGLDYTGRWLVGHAPLLDGAEGPRPDGSQIVPSGALTFGVDESITRIRIPAGEIGLGLAPLPAAIGLGVEAIAVGQDVRIQGDYPGYDLVPDGLYDGQMIQIPTVRLGCLEVVGAEGEDLIAPQRQMSVPAQAELEARIGLRAGCAAPAGGQRVDLLFSYPDNMPGKPQGEVRRGRLGLADTGRRVIHLPWSMRP